MADQNRRIKGGHWSASDPAVGAVAINYASGDQVLSEWGRAIYVSADGNLAVVMNNGDAVTFVGLKGGAIYPIAVKQITQSGSTASGLVLL